MRANKTRGGGGAAGYAFPVEAICWCDSPGRRKRGEDSLNEAFDQRDVVLANLPAGQTESRVAFAIALALLGTGAIMAPFGRLALPPSNAWVPITDTFIFAADMLTWFLLISQFNILRTRALLALASGYLFAAVINVPHLLTFPGVFSPTGLLGAGLQTAVWLAIFWMVGYPVAVIFYALMMKEAGRFALHSSTRTAVAASVAAVVAIAATLTWVAVAGEPYLPKLFLNTRESTAGLRYVSAFLLVPCTIALLLLWFRERSVLHLWLMVVMCGWIGQGIVQINTPGRFSLAMYAARSIFLISSTLVLIVLLKETMTLYVRLAVSLVALRRLTAEKLQRSEAYLTEAQRLSHTGSFGWSVPGGVIHWSEETYKIFEYDPSVKPTLELVLQRIHPGDRDLALPTIDRTSSEKKDVDIEHRLLMPDGRVKHLHVLTRARKTSSGSLEIVGAVTDVTQRKQAEEALRQAKTDLTHISRINTAGELTASLAHEVNQPIAAAVLDANTCLRWLARDPPDLEEARAAASRIVKDAIRATEIIKRTRMLFRKGDPQRELVHINELIQELVVLLRSEAALYSISVRTELALDIPRLVGDRVQLQQVLMNLVINGIESMRDVNGSRDLSINSRRSEDEQIMVSISDTGVGLPREQVGNIFNAFFTTKPHGTGMGLRISQSIVESHGGRLWAAENFPRGAIFHVTLPTKSEPTKL
jgi:PAS domain S-box-containing protein